MLFERLQDAVVVWAPAKVNLFLEVLSKRADGYHEIETLMVAVTLFDTLEIKEESGGDIRLATNYPQLSTGSNNLVRRAAALLKDETGCKLGASIGLHKRIPMEAGLGGGSSDAAAALLGLNLQWKLGLDRAELMGLAAKLGSDVPFFLDGSAAWCTGRGEKVEPLAQGRVLWMILVCPLVGLATAGVYQRVEVSSDPVAGGDIRAALASGDVEKIGRHMHNRLEPAALPHCQQAASWLGILKTLQPAGQLLSGSGSTVFGLCRDRSEALRVARAIRLRGVEETCPRVFLVRSCF
jgi:4-diphosphocytidyl-2-C-methyl-D-erythritol kinase